MHQVCAIGAAALDIKARMARPVLDTSDVPGRISTMPGGASRNVAENLARLGVHTTFIGVLGDDTMARSVVDASRAAGIDFRPVTRSEHATASLAVTIDSSGRQIAGVFSGEILDTLSSADLIPHRDAIRSAQALVVDSSVPQAVLVDLTGTIPADTLVYGAPSAPVFAPRLRPICARCDLITCNHLEAESLVDLAVRSVQDAERAARALVACGARRAVVTVGPHGLAYADAARSETRPALPARVVDATGAGDALAAAMIYALLRGDDVESALKLGLSAAALTCEVETSVAAALSPNLLLGRPHRP